MSLIAIDSSVLLAVTGLLGPVIGVVVGSLLNKKLTVSAARELANVEKAKQIDNRLWGCDRRVTPS